MTAKMTYDRIIAGMAWPTPDKEGYLVALAEAPKERGVHDRHRYILAEGQNIQVSELVKDCLALRKEYRVALIYGDTTNEPMMDMARRISLGFSLTEAPHVGDPDSLNGYISMIREHTRPEHKFLHFGDSQLPGRLNDIPQERLSRSTPAEDYPQIAALGYALSASVVFEFDPREQRDCERANLDLLMED